MYRTYYSSPDGGQSPGRRDSHIHRRCKPLGFLLHSHSSSNRQSYSRSKQAIVSFFVTPFLHFIQGFSIRSLAEILKVRCSHFFGGFTVSLSLSLARDQDLISQYLSQINYICQVTRHLKIVQVERPHPNLLLI